MSDTSFNRRKFLETSAGAAAVAHGIASRLAPHQAGLVASDLLPGLQRALEGEGRD